MIRPPAVVVIGASSGGLTPLRKIAASLPSDFPATILVATHTAPTSKSLLPLILSADGPLPATRARDGQPLEPGRILVAPPDRHLRVGRGGKVRVSEHPVHTALRPSADVLFESAARELGPQALGVVLSGRGSDGAIGLAKIRAAGGLAIVQAPDDAQFPSMPLSALASVKPDACLAAAKIAGVLDRLVRERLTRRGAASASRKRRKGRRRGNSLRGMRVLVAEDRYLLGSEIVAMLGKLGCSAAGPVPDVALGLRLLHGPDHDVDCAVLDLDLRGKPVFPLAQALRRRRIPIVFVTGYGAASLPRPWLRYPRVEKPFDAKALGAALRAALRPARDRATPQAPALVFGRAAEKLKELRNLLMVSQAWLRGRGRDVDRGTAEEVAASVRSVRASRQAVAASRAILDRTDDILTQGRGRRVAARRTLRSRPSGERR